MPLMLQAAVSPVPWAATKPCVQTAEQLPPPGVLPWQGHAAFAGSHVTGGVP